MKQSIAKNAILMMLFFLFLPAGIFKIWRSDKNVFLKIAYAVLGLPWFVMSYTFMSIITFAAFLPQLDMSVADRKDRTIVNSEGNYSATFIKTALETNNAYEFIQVEIEPGGGNGWHYHKDFAEEFTVVKGTLTVYVQNKTLTLHSGMSAIVKKKLKHYFRNNTNEMVIMTVRTTPAKGLEKSLRVGYGLVNTGQFGEDGLTKNPWHIILLMAYSGTYLADAPPFIQEPLVDSLAKIAQWKGEDKPLEVFFR